MWYPLCLRRGSLMKFQVCNQAGNCVGVHQKETAVYPYTLFHLHTAQFPQIYIKSPQSMVDLLLPLFSVTWNQKDVSLVWFTNSKYLFPLYFPRYPDTDAKWIISYVSLQYLQKQNKDSKQCWQKVVLAIQMKESYLHSYRPYRYQCLVINGEEYDLTKVDSHFFTHCPEFMTIGEGCSKKQPVNQALSLPSRSSTNLNILL